MPMPKLYIVAGPNGSGKTTFAREFLPYYARCSNFINADLIARGLSPFLPSVMGIKAGKLLLLQVQEFIKQKADFAFETTLAGKSYVNLINEAKGKGYLIHIFFLWIPDVKLAQERIKQRVKEGGHNVPTEDVKRRFSRSLRNFIGLYGPLCDTWILFDNAGEKPVVVAKETKKGLKIINVSLYENFLEEIDDKKI